MQTLQEPDCEQSSSLRRLLALPHPLLLPFDGRGRVWRQPEDPCSSGELSKEEELKVEENTKSKLESMRTFTSLMMVCLLALLGTAVASKWENTAVTTTLYNLISSHDYSALDEMLETNR